MFEHDPKLQLAVGAGAVLFLGIFAYVSSVRDEPLPLPPDAMDGVYENGDCPSFIISGGKLSFEGGAIEGKLERANIGYVLETGQSLRYEIGQEGCRFVIDEGGANLIAQRQTFASPVIMIQLFSADHSRGMYWTRTGAPES